MKKLFTLLAFLTCFLGAKAEWVEVYSIDYSTHTGFPFYVMGYVPEWVDGVMTDYGAMYTYKTEGDVKDGDNVIGDVSTDNNGTVYKKIQLESAGWHQYFIADHIPTNLDGSYKVTAMVKASEAVTINVNMGWGWGNGEQAGTSVSIGTEWAEVEWEYSGIAGNSCNLVAQPGGSTATIEWKWVKVTEDQREQRPVSWKEWLTDDGQPFILDAEHTNKWMGDAETAWPAWSLEKDGETNINWRTDRASEICAWALTMGKNNDAGPRDGSELDGRARPYPADIEPEAGNASNHVFAVHVDQIEKIDDDASIQWSNQFWIQAPRSFKAGEQVRIKFRYKAGYTCSVATQWHKMNPSDYLNWTGVGSIDFTEEWQEYDKVVTLDTDGTWSLAFNLTSGSTTEKPQEPNIFYFDDLSWETMVLDEGLFVASCNKTTGVQYDYDNAIEFVEDPTEPELFIATVGTAGKQDTWVNEVMISTVRGNDASFKANTLKPAGTIKTNDPDNWQDYTSGSLAKITLPAAGVWKISIAPEPDDPSKGQVLFMQVEGETPKEPVEIVTNETESVINGTERNYTENETKAEGFAEELPEGYVFGQPWDNQFWIAANRDLETDEVTVIKFQYKATKAAKTSTQAHKVGDDGKPCTYLNWQAIGDVNFTEEWQDFETEFKVPAGDNGMRSIVFNMAEIKEANDYYIKNVQWYVKDEELEAQGKTMENLINATGADNFWIKVNKGNPESAGTGISTVVSSKKASSAIYNIAGQKVDKNYKGLVIKNGKKMIQD